MFNLKDSGFRHSTNNITDKLSPCKMPLRDFMGSVVNVFVSLDRVNIKHDDFVRFSIVLVIIPDTFANFKTCSNQL